ncbi:MAG: hypothetical protein RQ756_01450 [Flavobacteriaceae bacterium]|nr:hypothetical protein [Flavobacteriaceae bacterium]
MRIKLGLIFMFFGVLACTPQDYGKLTFLDDIPLAINETSGLIYDRENDLIWTHNDSGNAPILFGVKPGIGIVKEIHLEDNIDWEDVAFDGNFVYVADTGDNNNTRTERSIYLVPKELLGQAEKIINYSPKVIHFSLPDQPKKRPKKKNRNFDIEAIAALENELLLFTKNRSSNFDGISKVYRLPKKAGNYTAEPIAELVICKDKKICLVTGAAYHKDSKQLVLITSDKLILYQNFTGTFSKNKPHIIALEHRSQKEAIDFINAEYVIISDERNKKGGGNLFRFKL